MAEYLHQPYFDIKGMDDNAKWRWIEERKWAYRGEFPSNCSCSRLMSSIRVRRKFARTDAHHRSLPLNFKQDRRRHVVRVNASLCPLIRLHAVLHTESRAFDLEKRQHLFAKHIFPPLQPHQTGFYGSGIVTDLGVDIQKAEDEIDAEFSTKPGIRDS